MRLTSAAVTDGRLHEKFGARGAQFGEGGMMTYSPPIEIQNAPPGTVSFALVMQDWDAIPVCGFSWIHWTLANLKRPYVLENESVGAAEFVQGTTSWSGALGGVGRLAASVYGGPAPPDKTHTYLFTAYALDCEITLDKGFYLNELYRAIRGHVLATAELEAIYEP